MDYSKNPEMLQKKPHKSRNVIDFFILPSPVQIRHPPETMVCKNEFGTIQRGCLYFVILEDGILSSYTYLEDRGVSWDWDSDLWLQTIWNNLLKYRVYPSGIGE